MTIIPENQFTAIVLAGDRGPDDPLIAASSAQCKAMIPVSGRPMLFRVLDALLAAPTIDTVILSGPPEPEIKKSPELRRYLTSPRISWQENDTTPSRSAYQTLQSLPKSRKVLLTTADHALLKPEIIDFFCRKARNLNADVVVGMENYHLLQQAFPESKRTVTRFKDGEFCSCNLFAFLTPQGRTAAEFWQKIEKERKKPLRLISLCGWLTVLNYFLGRLTLSQALRNLAKKMDLTADVVLLPFPEAAIDVDKIADLELVNRIIAEQNQSSKLTS